jgi:hypothetical protein
MIAAELPGAVASRSLVPPPALPAQVTCYEDSRLLKLFVDIVKILYGADVVGEDSLRTWYAKGSNPKGRNVFLKDMEPFIKW